MRTLRMMGVVAVLLAAVPGCGGGSASARSTPDEASTVSPTGAGAADCAAVRERWNKALEAGLTPPAKGPSVMNENTTKSLEAASEIMNASPTCFSDWDVQALKETMEFGKKAGATLASKRPTPSP
ncbi:hypothetical protein ACFXPM_07575 [Streptomyces sp. NPDC059095]|uniref:hypothetical protein n=1 Tax=unclassified Streptomyces TaxID=2593676 RepID=UPI0035D97BBF